LKENMAQNKQFLGSKELALDDTKNMEDRGFPGGGIIAFVEERYTRAEESRKNDEIRWLRAYRNYRGLYGPDVKFTETEKSRVFIKVTKTKTLAAYGQITDVLFSNNKFPLSVDPTTLPDGVLEDVHFDPNEKETSAEGPLKAEDFTMDKMEEMLLEIRETTRRQSAAALGMHHFP
jgi:hypothetical protein